MRNLYFFKLNTKKFFEVSRYRISELFDLIFKPTSENYYRVESCRKNPDGKMRCVFVFDSYSGLKKFQRRLQKFSFGITAVVFFVVASSLVTQVFLPAWQTKAATFTVTWTSQDDFENNDVTGLGATTMTNVNTASSSGDIQLSQFSGNFTETFSTTGYKDADETSADWNTTTGQLEFPASGGLSISDLTGDFSATIGTNEEIKWAIAYDNNVYFLTNTKYLMYDFLADETTDISYKMCSNFLNSMSLIYDIYFSEYDRSFYFAGRDGRVCKHNLETDAMTSLYGKFGSTEDWYAMTHSTTTGVVYVGGYHNTASGFLYEYNVDTDMAVSLYNELETFWPKFGSAVIGTVTRLDSGNGKLHLSGGGGVGSYDLNTGTGVTYNSLINSIIGTGFHVKELIEVSDYIFYSLTNSSNHVLIKYDKILDTFEDITSSLPTGSTWFNSFIYEPGKDEIYIGMYNKLVRYGVSTGTTTDLSSNIPSWGYINDFVRDETTNDIYFVSGTGKFGKYNSVSGVFTDLTGDISSYWSTYTINALEFDEVERALYLGGQGGKFGRYDIASSSLTDISSSISSYFLTSTINAMTLSSSTRKIYFGYSSSRFGEYNLDTGTSTNLSSKVTVNIGMYIRDLMIDPEGENLYIAGSTSGTGFAKMNLESQIMTDLKDYVTPYMRVVTDGLNAFAFSLENDAIYAVGQYGFAVKYYPSDHSVENMIEMKGILAPAAAPTALKYLSDENKILASYNLTDNKLLEIDIASNTINNLTSYVGSAGISGNLIDDSMEIDAINKDVYLGDDAGNFIRYNYQDDSVENLTSQISSFWPSGQDVTSTYFDADKSRVYLTGENGGLAYHDTGSATSTSLKDKISSSLNFSNKVYSSIYSAYDNSVYFGMDTGKFAKYDLDTEVITDLSSTISSFLSGFFVYSMAYDNVRNEIYLGASSGRFGKYSLDTGTSTNLTSLISGIFSFNNIESLLYNPITDEIFIGGAYGKFVKYNPQTGVTDLQASISGIWGTTASDAIYDMALDTSRNEIYLGGGASKFGKIHATSSAVQSLTAEIVGFWTTSYGIYSLMYHPDTDEIYLGGNGTARFAKYQPGGSATDLRSASFATFWGNYSVDAINYQPLTGEVFIGGNLGNFAKYNPWTGDIANLKTALNFKNDNTFTQIRSITHVDSNSTFYIAGDYKVKSAFATSLVYGQSLPFDSVGDNIGWATLTAVDSEIGGELAYYLSNNGGSNWQTATSGEQIIFETIGSDLVFKAGIQGAAYVDSLSIDYGGYKNQGTIEDILIDAGDEASFGNISWNATLNGQTINFYSRSASTSPLLASASWDGPYNISATQILSEDNRWLELKAELNSTGTTSPVVHDISAVYVINASPEVQSVTATQTSSGIVTVIYDIRDPDGNDGTITPNEVAVGLQYCTANCSSAGAETWVDAVTLSGDYGPGFTVEEAAWSSYSLTWNPKSDYDENYNNTNFKIRVVANDSEPKRNLGYGESNNFILDTTDPTSPDVTVDAIEQYDSFGAILGHSVNDEAGSMQAGSLGWMRIAQGVDSTACSAAITGSAYALYTATSSLVLTSDPATVCVQFKDEYGNESIVAEVTTPETPPTIMVQDISNVKLAPFEYRLFIAWSEVAQPPQGTFDHYSILRSSDNDESNFMELTTISDIAVNYYTDTTTVFDTLYYYKIVTNDDLGNSSFRSAVVYGNANGTQDAAEGGGGTESTPPAITNLAVSDIFTTQAMFTWDTDELSDSLVGYSTSTGVFDIESGVSTMADNAAGVGQHRVVVTGFSPNTTYYYRVRSVDPTGNVGTADNSGAGYAFTTLAGPTLSHVTVDSLYNTSAVITWNSDNANNSYVTYSTNSDMSGSTQYGFNDSTTDHSITLTGLTESTKYYFYVESGGARDDNAGDYYTFTTPTGPAISNVQAVAARYSATITWDTNNANSSYVVYAEDTSFTTFREVGLENAVTEHMIMLTGLDENTTYYYYVRSGTTVEDDGGVYYSFTTAADTTAPTISDISVSPVTDTSAVVNWLTDELASSLVAYGTQTGTYGLTSNNVNYNLNHAISLTALSPNTTYYLRITSADVSANSTQSAEQSFTTQATPITEEEAQAREEAAEEAGRSSAPSGGGGGLIIIDNSDKIPPVISEVKVVEVGDTFVKISWKTDEEATSIVSYGTTKDYIYAQANQASLKNKTLTHLATVQGLNPSTEYHFSANSIDQGGNLSSSEDYIFSTLILGEKSIKDVALVEGDTIDSEASLEKIQVLISNLLATGKATEEIIRDAIIKVSNPPTISGNGPSVKDITNKSVTIVWSTDRKSNSVVVYYPTEFGPDFAQQVGDFSKLDTEHEIYVNGLSSGTNYEYFVQSVDALGNIGISSQKDFTTESVPYISKVSMANLTNASIDISWVSNVETNSQVDYGTTDNYGQLAETNKDSFTSSHGIQLRDLNAATTYHFCVKGVSRTGEIITSDDYTFTTLERLGVLSYNLLEIGDKEATISWETNAKSTTELIYSNVETGVGETITRNEYIQNHSIDLINLTPGTKYKFRIKGQDESGQVIESEDFNFTTLIDTQAPIIEYVKADMAIISKGEQDSVQAVITWNTDEPSTSEVIYTEGASKELEKNVSQTERASTTLAKIASLKDESLSKKHVLVITDFKPGIVYTFRAKSVDESGNVSYSKDYTVLTPKKAESVLQVIIRTFEDTFGWLKVGN